MARRKNIKTRYPRVYQVEGKPGQYRIVGSVTDQRTGKKQPLDMLIEAKNPRAAADRRSEELKKLASGRHAPAERKRLDEYATSWSAAKRPSLKASTRAHYASVLDNCILPELGDFYLDAITSDDIAAWRDDQAKQLVTRDGKKELIDPVTVNGRLRILKQLLRDAVDDEGLDRDPTRRVEPLREVVVDQGDESDEDEDAAKSITAPQLAELLETLELDHPHWYPFFYVLAFTGLRFGEASALKWADLDKEAGKLRVRRAQWKGIVDTTKTASSSKQGRKKRSGVRSVPLFPELVEVLERHRKAQADALLKRLKRAHVPNLEVAVVEQAHDWMFPAPFKPRNKAGVKLMHNTSPAKPLRAALSKLPKLPQDFTIHGFRHTFNNLVRQAADQQGQGEVVRAMTGHSSLEMTEHYSHVSVEEKAAVVGKVVQLVRGKAR